MFLARIDIRFPSIHPFVGDAVDYIHMTSIFREVMAASTGEHQLATAEPKIRRKK